MPSYEIIWSRFYENTVYHLSERLIRQQEENMKVHYNDFKENIVEHFRAVSKIVKKEQEEHNLAELNALYYIQLNMNIWNKTFEYPVLAFDSDIFSKDYIEISSWNVSVFYEKLIEFWAWIEEESKKYVEVALSLQIENIVIKEAQKYHLLLKDFMADMIHELIVQDEFKKIKLQKSFHILMGGFYDCPFQLITINH